jgi:para-aminobenzoate synthetase/4-amino-4-deoxychorismate lyase
MPSTPSDPRRPDPGVGVFDTLLARGGHIQALAAHLDRLAASIGELYGASLPGSLADDLRRRATGPGERRLRVDVVPAPGGVRTEIRSSELPPDRHRQVTCRPLRIPGGLGRHKWADRRLIDSAGKSATALIVDREDELLEAAWANLFIVEGRRLITPPADGRLLPGIVRCRLLEDAPALGLEPAEERVSLSRARSADAVLLTSSLRHAVPAALGGDVRPADELATRIRGTLASVDWE